MGYLKRKDGTLQVVNGEYVKENTGFVVINANSLTFGLPSVDLLDQNAVNRFLIRQLAAIAGQLEIFTADTQYYSVTSQDYIDKFGHGATGNPYTASSAEGVSTVSQSAANAQAMANAKAKAIAVITYTPPRNTSGQIIFRGVNAGLI